jgi:two-component system sensor kinase FixL
MEQQPNEPVHIYSRWLDDSLLECSVSNTGKGVNQQDVDVLFDPFFTTKETGMGIGLTISRTII